MMGYFNVVMSYNGRRLMAHDCACPLVDLLQNAVFLSQRRHCARSSPTALSCTSHILSKLPPGPMVTMGHESGQLGATVCMISSGHSLHTLSEVMGKEHCSNAPVAV